MTDSSIVPVVAVGGVVIAPGPRVLLVRRAKPPMLGSWTLPGGRLLGGETIARGVEREVFEETGLRVSCGPLVLVVEIATEGYHYVVHDHLCRPLDPHAIPQGGDDAAEARFVALVELHRLGVTDAVAEVVTRALAMGDAWHEDE